MIQRRTGDVDNLKKEPGSMTFPSAPVPFTWCPKTMDEPSKKVNHDKEYNDDNDDNDDKENKENNNDFDQKDINNDNDKNDDNDENKDEKEGNKDEKEGNKDDNDDKDHKDDNELTIEGEGNDDNDVYNDDYSEDESDAGEWITRDNIHRFRTTVERNNAPETSKSKVSCISTDYSIQNMCMQMGLQVLSVDGMRVRRLKLWGLLCSTCQQFTKDTTKRFCPKCGHSSVVRVPIEVDDTGAVTVFDTRRKNNVRGCVYSIPKNRGGRNQDMILAGDELLMRGRETTLRQRAKANQKTIKIIDPLNPMNPFDSGVKKGARGGTSRNTVPIVVGYGRGNPNSNRFQKHNTRR
eukprot:GHVR01010637.1.p1 GENE.GHVR01010637.1~~GHVR01010637.1.p1  ORF type:complete len:350 (+),score=106.49 GHVR01010637.1:191-1240(+)